jgi:hypothetical protein
MTFDTTKITMQAKQQNYITVKTRPKVRKNTKVIEVLIEMFRGSNVLHYRRTRHTNRTLGSMGRRTRRSSVTFGYRDSRPVTSLTTALLIVRSQFTARLSGTALLCAHHDHAYVGSNRFKGSRVHAGSTVHGDRNPTGIGPKSPATLNDNFSTFFHNGTLLVGKTIKIFTPEQAKKRCCCACHVGITGKVNVDMLT